MKKIVVKISSNLLNPDNDVDMVYKIAKEINELKKEGNQVIVVTSGAVMHGVKILGYDKKPDNIPLLQSCAAIGQIQLMTRYIDAFAETNMIPSQILVSTEDFNNRKRYLNLRNTVTSLLALGAVPIFNENDSINIEELKFGDNDHLSSLITLMMGFDMLIILSDVDGLYEEDPKVNKNAKLITCIDPRDDSCVKFASNSVSKFSTGGMKTKLQSAQKVAKGGIDVFIGNGFKTNLSKIINFEERGTYARRDGVNINARKIWLGFSPSSSGQIIIDEGAFIALTEKSSSLLASGIKEIKGNFLRGSLVGIYYNNKKVAQGLTNYSSKEIELIKGKKSQDFHLYIKNYDHDMVIHKNNLYLA